MPSLLQNLTLLALDLPPIPGLTPEYRKPDEALSTSYFDLLEQNGHLIYPALAFLVLGLLVFGIVQAWRTNELDGLQKTELKREIILVLRKQLGGETVDSIARAIGLEPFKTVKLLEEMHKDGILDSHTSTARQAVWRVKGVGPQLHGAGKSSRSRSRSS